MTTITDRWRRLDVVVRDLPLAAALFTLALLPVTHGYGTVLGGLPDRSFASPALAAVALQSLPLAVRRRWPALCLALVSAGFAVDQLNGFHTFAGAGLVVALLSAGSYLERHRRLAVAVFTAGYSVLVAGMYRLGTPESLSEFVTFYVAMAFAVGVGAWQRAGRIAERDRLNRIAEDTRSAERTRMARELHDVVTHHVTAMVVQAEAARYLTGTPDRLDGALETIAGTGRRAVSDLRQVLDVLNPGYEEPGRAPGIAELRGLVENARLTGLRVDFAEEGTPPREMDDGAQLALYRVVQEALTNARKHATGSRTAVSIRYQPTETTVLIHSDAAAPPFPDSTHLPAGSGRGLTGLRERLAAVSGDFSAGRQEDGSFTVSACVPTDGPA